ncbi:MAG: Thymidine kinase [Chlamydiae bacterium]|nr:Thymidine kinase [Chlamydiota bacterium]
MAKLYFRYGAMGSAKTLNLLAVAHNYTQQKKSILMVKPIIDDRFGKNNITSRAGLEKEADILVDNDTDLHVCDFTGIDCILVDEAQFLSAEHVDQLRAITVEKNIPVICYGLRADFQSNLFSGSKRLMELADSIEELKTTCFFCNRKGTMNLRHVNGKAAVEGPSIAIGADDMYYPACYKCYSEQIAEAKADQEKVLA